MNVCKHPHYLEQSSRIIICDHLHKTIFTCIDIVVPGSLEYAGVQSVQAARIWNGQKNKSLFT